MEISYELTEKDFRDAIIAHRNRTKSSKWAYRVLMILAMALLGINLIGIVMRPITRSLPHDFPIAIIMLWGIGTLWCGPRLTAKRQYVKQPSAHGARTVLMDSDGIHWRWNEGTADNKWNHYVRFVESKDHFLIYSSPACFNIVPKRAMSVEDMANLRGLVAQNLPNSK